VPAAQEWSVTVPVGLGVPMLMRMAMTMSVGVTCDRGVGGRALVSVGVPAAPRVLVCPLTIGGRRRAVIVAGERTGGNGDRARVHHWLAAVHQQIERR
jgi:hypothetical protein